MAQREVNITGGPNNTKALVTGLQELLVLVSDNSGLATEATLELVRLLLVGIEADTTAIETNTGLTATNTTAAARTTGMLRPNNGDAASGDLNTVQATFFSVSVANVGSSDGTVLGKTIKPNESLNFTADAINNYFSSFTYDATGTEFILIYVY
jgi:hypothetical protein